MKLYFSHTMPKSWPTLIFFKDVVMKQGQKVFEIMAKYLFIWTSLSMLLMILLDAQKWDKLSILKNISIIKKIIAPGILNRGLEIPS